MPSFALSAIGPDRPGIVAAISRVLFERGCNVEDSTMTLLRGNFAVMLVLTTPDGVTAEGLEDALRPACDRLGLLFSVRGVGDEVSHPHPTHTLTVYGADKPGILFRVSEALAAQNVNITDLTSRLVGEDATPVYVLLLELSLPPDVSEGDLTSHLNTIAADVGVDVTVRAVDEDVL